MRQHIGGGGGQGVVEQALLLKDIEEPGQTDGNAHSGELFIGIIFRKVIIPAAGTHRTDLRV